MMYEQCGVEHFEPIRQAEIHRNERAGLTRPRCGCEGAGSRTLL